MNVRDMLVKTARQFPDKEILISLEKRLTAKELVERSFRLANALIDLGLKKEDRVGVLMTNSHYSAEAANGIMCAGLARVPLNTRHSGKEHLFILNNSEARAVIIGEEFIEVIQSIRSKAEKLEHVICVTDKLPAGLLGYEEFVAKASPEEPDVELKDEDLHRLSYTSGTTGQPKGVFQDNRAAMTSLYNVLIDGLDIQPTDVVALTSPVTHASGSMILPHLVRGAKVVILPGFDPRTLLETIEKERKGLQPSISCRPRSLCF